MCVAWNPLFGVQANFSLHRHLAETHGRVWAVLFWSLIFISSRCYDDSVPEETGFLRRTIKPRRFESVSLGVVQHLITEMTVWSQQPFFSK